MTPGFPDPVLRVSGVSKTFDGPGGATVLREVDLAVASGEYVTVQGRSGSGKSTLLNVLGLLDRPTEGTYELAGLDTGLLDDRARTSLRAASIGFVFQAFHLLDDRSALENVMMGLLYRGVRAGAARTEALDALHAVGMAPFAARQPGSLSGGERQRVAIARAIVGRPAVLLADEPTGNLDTENAQNVMETFAALNAAGTTIVLITHDLEVARAGTRHLAMTDGQLAVSAR